MRKYIEFTRLDDTLVIVNSDLIHWITSCEQGSFIAFSRDDNVIVKESYEEVQFRLGLKKRTVSKMQRTVGRG